MTTTSISPERKAWNFVFVVEDGLGHAVHALNIERVLAATPGVVGHLIRVAPDRSPNVPWLGRFVSNWSLQASRLTRRAVEQHLAQHPIDALFIHTQVASLLARPIMRRVPTIISLDATPVNFDSMAEAYRHPRQGRALECGKRAINRRAMEAADAIVTWSRWAADSVSADYGIPAERVHVIPPGVDVSRFRPHAGERTAGPMRVLFVGGDFARKGGEDLLEAMRLVGPGVELDIVSPRGVAPTDLPVRVHSDVGANSHRMIELLSRADVFVLPSRGDCTPLAIGEAMACGLPIVTTTVGALPELVVDGSNGLVVPPGDPQRLSAALARLAADPDVRREMGQRSRMIAESEHDVTKNCMKIFALMCNSARKAGGSTSGERRPVREPSVVRSESDRA
jgi:glycosyltransferase involved in cell wall biosynthesis